MQTEFKLSPLKSPLKPVVLKTYKWKSDILPGKPGTKYAVLFQNDIIAMFSSLYWAKKFSKDCINIEHTIMEVDE